MTRKIVVVEDDQPILDLMEILLKKLGYDPVLIPNGLDALNYVRSEPPALILLDIMMSPLSGWEFLDRLRTEYNQREIPVILFTASPTVPGRWQNFMTRNWASSRNRSPSTNSKPPYNNFLHNFPGHREHGDLFCE